MKVIVVVDNDAYLNYDNDTESAFGQIQQEIYDKYLGDKAIMNDSEWEVYDHDWRTDERLVKLAENMSMFKVAVLPNRATDFMTTCRMGDSYEDLLYVVDGKIFWYE